MKTRTFQKVPHECFLSLQAQGYKQVSFLESHLHTSSHQYSTLAANPIATFKIHQGQTFIQKHEQAYQIEGTSLKPLDALIQELVPQVSDEALPYFTGGALGAVSYDYCRYQWPQHEVGKASLWPECVFHIYDWSLVYDHHQHHYLLCGNIPESLETDLECLLHLPEAKPITLLQELQSHTSKQEYIRSILQIQEWIREGDVYQVNLSQQFYANVAASSSEIFQKLRLVNPADFSGYFPISENQTLLSSSPELFFGKQGSHLRLRPIKGTAPRFQDPKQDEASKQSLLQSEKDHAELLMITDLERNDLGKVCEYGSIQVPQLYTLESYATVHHLVSTIEGTLRQKHDWGDLLDALFPCGSITGAPKLRSMERIAQLETAPRAFYTGNLGWVDAAGNSVFNVMIRSILMQGSQVQFNAGGGITIESDPEAEYEETLHKAKGLQDIFVGP